MSIANLDLSTLMVYNGYNLQDYTIRGRRHMQTENFKMIALDTNAFYLYFWSSTGKEFSQNFVNTEDLVNILDKYSQSGCLILDAVILTEVLTSRVQSENYNELRLMLDFIYSKNFNIQPIALEGTAQFPSWHQDVYPLVLMTDNQIKDFVFGDKILTPKIQLELNYALVFIVNFAFASANAVLYDICQNNKSSDYNAYSNLFGNAFLDAIEIIKNQFYSEYKPQLKEAYLCGKQQQEFKDIFNDSLDFIMKTVAGSIVSVIFSEDADSAYESIFKQFSDYFRNNSFALSDAVKTITEIDEAERRKAKKEKREVFSFTDSTIESLGKVAAAKTGYNSLQQGYIISLANKIFDAPHKPAKNNIEDMMFLINKKDKEVGLISFDKILIKLLEEQSYEDYALISSVTLHSEK